MLSVFEVLVEAMAQAFHAGTMFLCSYKVTYSAFVRTSYSMPPRFMRGAAKLSRPGTFHGDLVNSGKENGN